ncbi:MAG: hypothetical protein J6B98_04310 [Bacilli bacterium]|nr:hypothetical protein [Bacilli bacterium]
MAIIILLLSVAGVCSYFVYDLNNKKQAPIINDNKENNIIEKSTTLNDDIEINENIIDDKVDDAINKEEIIIDNTEEKNNLDSTENSKSNNTNNSVSNNNDIQKNDEDIKEDKEETNTTVSTETKEEVQDVETKEETIESNNNIDEEYELLKSQIEYDTYEECMKAGFEIALSDTVNILGFDPIEIIYKGQVIGYKLKIHYTNPMEN